MKVSVTVKYAVQISYNDYAVRRITRLFSVDRPIKDILTWANNYLPKNQHNDLSLLEFSEYTGDSI